MAKSAARGHKGGKAKSAVKAGHTSSDSSVLDKVNNPDHLKLSDSTARMSRSGGDLAGPTMWGEPNGQDMGITPSNEQRFY